MTSHPGRVLANRYRLLDPVGRGGMGAVWRARDDLLGREVAVKEIILPEGLEASEREEMCGRALREARAAAQVRHPAIITIHDVVIEGGQPWIVMEYLPVPSLADRIKDDGPLDPVTVARMGIAVLEALEVVHQKGILHRDIKPANILLSDTGAVVTDFGIATIEGDVRYTRSGVLAGSPGYMAPERLAGGVVGPSSDLWSLGATLYTAVEGIPAFAASTPYALAAAVLGSDPRPPQRAGALASVLSGLLEKDPDRRMNRATAAELLQRVAATAPDRPTAEPITLPITRPAPAVRHPLLPQPAPPAPTPDEPIKPSPIEPSPIKPFPIKPFPVMSSPERTATQALPATESGPRPWQRMAKVGRQRRTLAIGAVVLVASGWYFLAHRSGPTVPPVPASCSLLTADQIAQTIGQGSKASDTGARCTWQQRNQSDGDSDRITLATRQYSVRKGASQAMKAYTHDRGSAKNAVDSDASSPVMSSLSDVENLGDQAFTAVLTEQGSPEFSERYYLKVEFRRANVVVDLELHGYSVSSEQTVLQTDAVTIDQALLARHATSSTTPAPASTSH